MKCKPRILVARVTYVRCSRGDMVDASSGSVSQKPQRKRLMRINKHSRQNPESQAAKPIRAEVPARKAVLGHALHPARNKQSEVTPADISQVPGHDLLSSVEMGRYVHGHASICEVLASSQGLQQQKDGLKTVAVALRCLRALILMPNCKPTLIVDLIRVHEL